MKDLSCLGFFQRTLDVAGVAHVSDDQVGAGLPQRLGCLQSPDQADHPPALLEEAID